VPERETSTASPPDGGTSRAHLWRSVALLVVMVIGANAWVHLHWPEWRGIVSTIGILLVGVPSVLGFLPKEDREVRGKIGRLLSTRPVVKGLLGVTVVLVLAAACWSSVRIETDAGSAEFYVMDGAQAVDTTVPTPLDTLRLSRSEPVDVVRLPAPPWGRPLWTHSSTHVSRSHRIALPWRPASWTYPEDFDELVTIYVLPTTQMDGSMQRGGDTLVLLEPSGIALARVPLSQSGARVDFVDRRTDIRPLAPIWRHAYRELLIALPTLAAMTTDAEPDSGGPSVPAIDTTVIPKRVRDWQAMIRIRTLRALHLGEKVHYALRFPDGAEGPFELVLERNPCHLFLHSAINHALTCAAPPVP
jgi:hypothetical protein